MANEQEQKEILPTINKITLATGGILYLAEILNHVKIEYAVLAQVAKDNVVAERAIKHETILNTLLGTLRNELESLADYMNNCDIITNVDERAMKGIFEILFEGKDEIEG